MLLAACLCCLMSAPPPHQPPPPILPAVCLCLLNLDSLTSVLWDATIWGNTFYAAAICAGLLGSVAQEPLPARAGCSLREARVPQVACSPPPTHTPQPRLAPLFRPVEVNSDTDRASPHSPSNTSHKPLHQGCQKGQRPAFCLGVVLKGLHR